MKKVLWFPLLSTLFLLCGCEMPFTVTEKEQLVHYVDAQAEVLTSVTAVDEQFRQTVEKTLQETKDTEFPMEQLVREVRSAKQTQQAMTQRLETQTAPYGKEAIHQYYVDLALMYQRSYDQYEEQIKNYDPKTLQSSLAQTKVKEQQFMTQTLLLINEELAHYDVKPRKSLLPELKK